MSSGSEPKIKRVLRGGATPDDLIRALFAREVYLSPDYRVGELGLRLMRRCPWASR